MSVLTETVCYICGHDHFREEDVVAAGFVLCSHCGFTIEI